MIINYQEDPFKWDSLHQPRSGGTLPSLHPLSSLEKYQQSPSGLLSPSVPNDSESWIRLQHKYAMTYPLTGLNNLTFSATITAPEEREPLEVVDRATPVVGFRAWSYGCKPKLGEDPKPGLLPVNEHFGPWTPGVNRAECRTRWGEDRHDAPHDAPHEDCECGFYVLADLDQLESHVYVGKKLVVGAVLGWGNVIQHGEEGWRAEYAQIIALMDIKRGKKALRRAETAADAYGVPLLSRQGIMATVAEYGDPLPKETG